MRSDEVDDEVAWLIGELHELVVDADGEAVVRDVIRSR